MDQNKRRLVEVLGGRIDDLEKRLREAYKLLGEIEKRLITSLDPVERARLEDQAEKLREVADDLIKEWKKVDKELDDLQ